MKTKSIRRSILTVAALCVALALLLSACSTSKAALSVPQFISKAESVNLKTQDTSSTYAEVDHVLSSTTAYESEGASVLWQADFLIANSEDKAKGMFENNKATFESVSGGSTVSSEIGNYATYEKNADGKFMYLCRVEKTMLYINIDEKYTDAAKKLIDAMGY